METSSSFVYKEETEQQRHVKRLSETTWILTINRYIGFGRYEWETELHKMERISNSDASRRADGYPIIILGDHRQQLQDMSEPDIETYFTRKVAEALVRCAA